jgi:WD40 repeat protein
MDDSAVSDETRQKRNRRAYDAFLSYNHRADHQISQRLHSALQRLAKPWNQPWAIRVFRDETDLTANAALWPKIKVALDQARYFILLASPPCAASRWVRKEVCYWLTSGKFEDVADGWKSHIDKVRAERVLIALTGGAIVWDDNANDFDWATTTALPRVLSQVFEHEPLWVILRDAVTTQDNMQFASAVARISVPIRFGESADVAERTRELLDQDYLEYRRSSRRNQIAAILLAVLAVGAIIAGAYAEIQREAAIQQQRNSDARALAVESDLARQQPDMLERSGLLAIESAKRVPLLENDHALRATLELLPRRVFLQPGVPYLSPMGVSPNGLLVAVATEKDRMFSASIIEMATGRLLCTVAHKGSVTDLSFSADSRFLATASYDKSVRVTDASSCKEILRLSTDQQSTKVAFSPDGNSLLLADQQFARRVVVLGGNEIWKTRLGGETRWLESSHNGRYVAVAGAGKGANQILKQADGRKVSLPVQGNLIYSLRFSPDDRRVVTASQEGVAQVIDISSAQEISRFTSSYRLAKSVFSPDGQLVATGGADGTAWVFRAQTGQQIARLMHQGTVEDLTFNPNGDLVATVSSDGTSRLFETSTGTEVKRIVRNMSR